MKTKRQWPKYLLLGGITGLIGIQTFHNSVFQGPQSRLRKALFYASLGTLLLYAKCGDDVDNFLDKDIRTVKQYEKQVDSLNNVINYQYTIIDSLDKLNNYLNIKNNVLKEEYKSGGTK